MPSSSVRSCGRSRPPSCTTGYISRAGELSLSARTTKKFVQDVDVRVLPLPPEVGRDALNSPPGDVAPHIPATSDGLQSDHRNCRLSFLPRRTESLNG